MRFEKGNNILVETFNQDGGTDNKLAIVIGVVDFVVLPDGGFSGNIRVIQDGALHPEEVVTILEIALGIAKQEISPTARIRGPIRSDVN